ncbi:MAG: hypothetical protein ACYTFK_00025 [Planctomycetota bacterium]
MEHEKRKWVKKYTDKAFDYWRGRGHAIGVSRKYRRQIEADLAEHYDDPLRRQFVEKTWAY